MSREVSIAESSYLSSLNDLERDPNWGPVDVSAFALANAARPELLKQPRLVVWKVRLMWSIDLLMSALGLTDRSKILTLAADYMTAQRRLLSKLQLDLTDPNQTTREAATKAQSLLLPDGLKHINLSYDQKIAFSRSQIVLADDQLGHEVQTLGLKSFMDHIAQSTEALSSALGMAPGKARDQSKSLRIREALRNTQRDFKAVLNDILWHAENTTSQAERDMLQQLAKPLQVTIKNNQDD